MKKLLLSTLMVTLLAAVHAQAVNTTPANTAMATGTSITLKETSFDFGKIVQGKPVYHVFEIVNTGKEALKLENVQTSCGCTTPEWSPEPVEPAATTTIKVGYNAATEGAFTKSITIVYNGNQTKTILISGNVYKAPATSAPVNPSISLLKQKNK